MSSDGIPLLNGLPQFPGTIGPVSVIGDINATGNITAGGQLAGASGNISGNLQVGGNVTVTGTIAASGLNDATARNARAARQGLVFDGTAGATFGNGSVIGTGAFTYAFWLYQPTAGTGDIISGQPGAPGLYVTDTGIVGINSVYTTSGPYTPAGVITAGKWNFVCYSKTSTASNGAAYYVNGVNVATVTDALNYTVAPSCIGKRGDNSQVVTGNIIPLIYNRALSASEVVTLFEAGVPSAADYNTASNTSVVTGFSNNGYAGGSPYTTFSGASATGFTAGWDGTGGAARLCSTNTFPIIKGAKYQVTFNYTKNSGAGVLSEIYLCAGNDNSGSNSILYTSLASGANTFTFTATYTGNSKLQFLCYQGVINYTISSLSLTPLGLLLAPDAAQAGGGLVWTDMSGNGAQILLPTSGVSWNVPSASNYPLRGSTNTNGNQQLLGGTTALAGAHIHTAAIRALTGTPTVKLGTTAGGNEIANAVTLAANTWTEITVKTAGNIFQSAGSIWVNSTTTDTIQLCFIVQPLAQ